MAWSDINITILLIVISELKQTPKLARVLGKLLAGHGYKTESHALNAQTLYSLPCCLLN